MTLIPISYEKVMVGNKLYTVEWDLSPQNAEDTYLGDLFEAVDSKLLSISAFSSEGIFCKLYASNLGSTQYGGFAFAMDVSGITLIPMPRESGYYPGLTLIPALLPPTRFIGPSSEGAAGLSRVALLYEEIH